MTSNSFEFKVGDIVELIGPSWVPTYRGQTGIITCTNSAKTIDGFPSIEAEPFIVSGPVFTKGDEFKVIRQSTLLERIIFNIKIEQK